MAAPSPPATGTRWPAARSSSSAARARRSWRLRRRRSPPPFPATDLEWTPMASTAVVTGAGRGLGRAIAERLVARGHQVLITDIDAAAAADTAAAIGDRAWAMTQDVRDPDSHRRAAAVAVARGPIAAWVNNAGVLTVGPAWDADDATIRRDVEVNVLGVMWGCRAAIDA